MGTYCARGCADSGPLAVFGLITYLGMIVAVRIKATGTRLFLVVLVFSVAYGAASLLEHILWERKPTNVQPNSEPTETWPRWLLRSRAPITLRDSISYSFVVLPQLDSSSRK